MAEVQLPDGNVARVPDFALEKTQEDMKRLLKALVGADDKAYKVFSKLVEQAKEQTEVTEDVAKEAKQLQKEQLKATKEVATAASKGKIIGDKLFSGALKADAFLTKSFMQLGSAAISVAGSVFQGIMEVGGTLQELGQMGVGLDNASGSASKLIADLSYLGMTAGDSAGLMKEYSGVINVMGKTGFVEIQRTFSQLSDNGARFGISIRENAEALAEDLELRKQLGMLGTIDATQQAQRSAELYDMQMQAAQALGKSVKEIRQESAGFIDSNIQARLALKQLGATAGPAALAAMEKLATSFTASGVDKTLADDLLTMIAEPVMGASESSRNLFTALQAGGDAGKKLAQDIQRVNELKKTDPAAFADAMKEMGPKITQALSDIANDPGAAKSMSELIARNHGAAGAMEQLIRSGDNATSALEALRKSGKGVINPLASASQAFDAAMDSISGTMSGAMVDFTAAFSGPADAFSNALIDNTLTLNGAKITQEEYNALTDEQKEQVEGSMSVMAAFQQAVQVVRNVIEEAFGAVGDDGKDLAQRIREYLVPAIKDFSDWFKDGGLTTIQEVWSGVSGFFSGLGDVIGVVTSALGSLASFVNGIFGTGKEEEVDEQGNVIKKQAADYSGLGKGIAYTVAGLFAFTKAIKLAQGAMALGGAAKSGISGLLGRGAGGAADIAGKANMGGAGAAAGGLGKTIGSLGTGIKTALTGLAQGIAKGVSSLAKGISSAFTSIMSGLAKGLAAFANPKILIGAGILGASITLIGAGVAGAAWIMGNALPTFAEGLDSFANIDGDNLVNVAKGIGAIGVAMAAMGAGGAAGAVGGAVSGIIEGIGSFFGADTPLDKLKEFASYDIDVAGIVYNAKAFTSFGEAMTSFGAGVSVSGIGSMIDGLASFMGADPVSMINKFADAQINVAGIDANIAALDRLDAMFAKYAALTPPENMGELDAAINKSAVKPEQPKNAYQTKAASLNRREALMQPGVMSVDKQGKAVEMPQVDTQAIVNEGTNALIGEFNKDASAPGAKLSTENIDALGRVMAQVAQNTRDTNKLLKRLDTSVQDNF